MFSIFIFYIYHLNPANEGKYCRSYMEWLGNINWTYAIYTETMNLNEECLFGSRSLRNLLDCIYIHGYKWFLNFVLFPQAPLYHLCGWCLVMSNMSKG